MGEATMRSAILVNGVGLPPHGFKISQRTCTGLLGQDVKYRTLEEPASGTRMASQSSQARMFKFLQARRTVDGQFIQRFLEIRR